MDSTLWIGPAGSTNDWTAYCAGEGSGTGPCVGGGLSAGALSAQTSTNKSFLASTNGVIQAHPTLATHTTPLETTLIMTAAGTTLRLAGTSSDENLLVKFDTTTNTATTIASSSSASGEIEFYHVEVPSDGYALFDGLRFSDNTYVIGKINYTTGAVTILSTITGKLDDFRVF